jgi:hypothetical protein
VRRGEKRATREGASGGSFPAVFLASGGLRALGGGGDHGRPRRGVDRCFRWCLQASATGRRRSRCSEIRLPPARSPSRRRGLRRRCGAREAGVPPSRCACYAEVCTGVLVLDRGFLIRLHRTTGSCGMWRAMWSELLLFSGVAGAGGSFEERGARGYPPADAPEPAPGSRPMAGPLCGSQSHGLAMVLPLPGISRPAVLSRSGEGWNRRGRRSWKMNRAQGPVCYFRLFQGALYGLVGQLSVLFHCSLLLYGVRTRICTACLVYE